MKYRHLKGYKYQLVKPEKVPVGGMPDVDTEFIMIRSGHMTVKSGYAWDGPSGPTIDTKTFMRGSLVHDALYQLIREGHLPFKFRNYADWMLRNICLADGMNKFRAWYVYYSVRLFAGRSALPRKNPRGKAVEILCNNKNLKRIET